MKRKAFTLIELLVVLGIIVFLIAILLPGLGLARKYADSIQCLSNIKIISLRLINYDIQNGNFPYSYYFNENMEAPDDGYLADGRYDHPGWWWINYIKEGNEEVRRDSVFWCPSRSRNIQKYKYDMLFSNYGVNQSICGSWSSYEGLKFSDFPLSITDIRHPSESILVVDSGYSIINWRHVTDSPPEPLSKSVFDSSYLPGLAINKDRKFSSPGLTDDAENGRHLNNSVNIGFPDGHGEGRNAEKLFIEKTQEGYKNLTPLWEPGKR